MVEPLPRGVVDALRGVGSELVEGPRVTMWFDGFWDFFVPARRRLETAPAAAVICRDMYVLAWMPEVPAGLPPRVCIEIFVEQRVPGGVASWPVSSVVVGTGASAPARGVATRSIDPAAAARLLRLGASVHVGRWGPHVTLDASHDVDRSTLAELIELAGTLVPRT